MSKKEGKVRTLLVEDIKDLKSDLLGFDGDVETIAVIPAHCGVTNLIDILANLKLWRVVAKPDPNLESLGINLDYHSVDPITVTDMDLTHEDHLLLNGTIELPRTPEKEITVIGGYFMDEEVANELCREINVHTAKRVDDILDQLTKSQKFRRDIADRAMS